MIEAQLINFYQKRLSNFSLVSKRILINHFFFFLLFFLFTWYAISFSRELTLIAALIIIILCATLDFSLLYILILNPSYTIAMNEYNTKFRSNQWELFRMLLLKEFLISSGILDTKGNLPPEQHIKKIDSLIDLLQNTLDNNRKNSILANLGSNINATIIFFIPAWTAFNSLFFIHKELTIEIALTRLVLLFYILMIITFIIITFKMAVRDFNFFNK